MSLEDDIKQNKFKTPQQKLAVNLIYTTNWLNYHYQLFFKESNLTSQQYNVLRILRGQYPKPSSLKLVKERMLDRMSDASRIVDKLVEKRYVDRTQCPNDRRSLSIMINEKGLGLLKKLDVIDDAMQHIFSNLNHNQIETLNQLLDTLRKEPHKSKKPRIKS